MRGYLCAFGLVLVSLCRAENESSIIDRLMRATSRAELQLSVQAAEDMGLPKQMLAEAQLNYGIRKEDVTYLRKALPAAEQAITDFKKGQSGLGLSSVEQLRGLVCYARALTALDAGEVDLFKTQVQEAVWLFPEQSSFFAKAISKHQRLQRLSRQTHDLGLPLSKAGGGKVSLGELLATQRALLLLFWSEEADPKGLGWKQLSPRLSGLKSNGVVPCIVHTSKPTIVTTDTAFTQITDPDQTLAKGLEITHLPTAVILSPQGRVLHHAHPEEISLWNQLQRLVPALRQGTQN
jgi:hypothetical protein